MLYGRIFSDSPGTQAQPKVDMANDGNLSQAQANQAFSLNVIDEPDVA